MFYACVYLIFAPKSLLAPSAECEGRMEAEGQGDGVKDGRRGSKNAEKNKGGI